MENFLFFEDSLSIDSFIHQNWMNPFKPRVPEDNRLLGSTIIKPIDHSLIIGELLYSVSYFRESGHLIIWEQHKNRWKLKSIYPHFAGGALYAYPQLKKGKNDTLIIESIGVDGGDRWGTITYAVQNSDTIFIPYRIKIRGSSDFTRFTKFQYDSTGKVIDITKYKN